jgi:peptidoglycan-N-acetylglucosamine deacetylase
MYFFSPPDFIKSLVPSSIIWDMGICEKKLYLTLDDGPTPDVTAEILNILNDFDAKATFFCLGEKVEKHPELFEKILANGHSVGNHTYKHLDAWKNNSGFLIDTLQAQKLIPSVLFRPPFGHLPLWNLKELQQHFKIIMWSLMSYDFDTRLSKEKILDVFRQRTHKGSIWVFHDTLKAKPLCLKVIPQLLNEFSKKGFVFEKL